MMAEATEATQSFQYKVDQDACRGCARCVNICLNDAAIMQDLAGHFLQKAFILPEHCTLCGDCEAICPQNAIHLLEV